MKRKIYLLTLAFCMLLACGCSKSEQQSLVDAESPNPTVTETSASTQYTEAVCEAEVTEPQEPVTTAENISTDAVTESSDEQAEKGSAIEETTPVESRPAETQVQVTEPPATEITKPEPTVPPTTKPPVTTPPATEPKPTETAPTETVPEPTETVPAEMVPEPTESAPTEPPVEVIDTAALEAYGRSYASGIYGYNGTSACHPGTGAGYFPAATKEITSMEEGYSIIRQAIDSQYKRDMAYGYTPYEEIDGQTVRCPINVSVTSAGGNTYTVTVYYGGTA